SLNPAFPGRTATLVESMDRLLDSLIARAAENGSAAPNFAPAVNVWQSDEAIHVEAELPGFSMGDIDVSILQNRLTVSGRRSEQAEPGRCLRRERRAGDFSRTLTLPVQIDSENVQARLENGVLRVD